MSSSDPRRRLSDIVENADRIGAYIADLDEVAFAKDHKSIDATERCLERITEAVIKIGAVQMATVAPDVQFERVRGLGNMLRHAYDDIDLKILFSILQNEIPALRAAAARALA